jgi:tetratricopeptide (TPR) repeat protein
MRGTSLLLVAAVVMGCGSPGGPATAPLGSAEEYVARGESLAEEGKYPEAIDHFSTAIEMDPQSAEAFFLRGRAHYDYAVRICTDLTGQPPEAVPFLPDEVVEQTELAAADYTTAVGLDPEYAKAYNNRGNARATLGDLGGALEDYDQALALDGSLTLTYFNRGAIQYRLGNYEEAIGDLRRYLELDPHTDDRERIEALIEEMGEGNTPQ